MICWFAASRLPFLDRLRAELVLDHCETAGGCKSSSLRSWVPLLGYGIRLRSKSGSRKARRQLKAINKLNEDDDTEMAVSNY
jgi:hypothetical protein